MMEEPLSRDVSLDAANASRDVSGVLSASSYSLRDISDSESFANADDADLLDESVLALLAKPYSQLQDRLHLRKQDQYDGFDNSTGSSWIYPTNYPVRQYQFTITKAALFKNTLVVLPTGLGKTFIAAVVMYNIYRWYPTGKVIFMAPTRPLVAQQIDACYRIMGIPREDTAEITGRQQRKSRVGMWQTKRVFYATPQVVQADLCAPEQAFPVDQVRLVVIDEAHKAKGRYAYTEVIRLIASRNKHFRVLALSATPGRTLEDVAEVIQNLMISHIEVRWDNSIDVSPYTFRRSIRTIVIPLGAAIRAVREQLQQLVDPYVRRLLDANVLACGNPASMTRGMLIMEQKRFRENSLHCRHPNHSTVNGDFGVCVSMYHALDLLVRHGIRALLNFFADGGEGASEKYFVAKDPLIKEFLVQLRERYGDRNDGLDGAAAIPATGNDDVDFGHPKFRILEQQLATHFADRPDSKAIVFCEFRDSVAMIHRLLSQRAPLIRPKCIVGQGGTSGIRAVTQKEQIAAMKQFRDGICNTLIATCVAEEGIDVGEVDLIVCFDITKNPTRFVQRIGRTGRQRVGRVLMLVTEGEEHQTLKRVLASKDRTNQQLARSKDIMRILYRHSPRLVPDEFEPKCMEMFITIDPPDGAPGDAAPETGKRKSSKPNHNAEVASKRRKVAAPSNTTTPPKATQSVRLFFQRSHARLPADGGLDVSEREVFALLDPPPAERSPKQPNEPHTGRTHQTPVDRCIRPGRSDQELAIERRVQPLVRHYEQLRRQKYIHRQQLLEVPTIEQILERRSLAIVRSELARHLLGPARNAPCDTVPPVVKLDDPFDLPPLRALPASYRLHCRSGEASPRFRPSSPPPDALPPTPFSPVMESSISNMFDSTLPMSELEHTGTLGTNRAPAGRESTATVSATAGRKRPAPVDSPLMRAFDRSMRKRLLDDGQSRPVAIRNAGSVPEPETPPVAAQATARRKRVADGVAPSRTPTVDSPLMRAFYRSVQKRSNSNGDRQEGAECIYRRQMVLEYFRLDSVEQIFADESGQESALKNSTAAPVKARNDASAGRTISGTSEVAVDPVEQSGPEKIAGPSGGGVEPAVRGVAPGWVSPRTPRRSTVPDPDQENRNRNKNFNLGSPAFVFEESEDDLFGSFEVHDSETAVAVPLGGKAELYVSPSRHVPGEMRKQCDPQRATAAKCILVETQQKERPVESGSHFEMKDKSPSVLAKLPRVASKSRLAPTKEDRPVESGSHFEMIDKSPSLLAKLPRVASKSRLAPTKLNFSRLRTDQRRPVALATEGDVMARPITPAKRTSSPFFNNCDSQLMSPPIASPLQPVVDPSEDRNESTITGRRLMRGRHQLISDIESEGEVEDVGSPARSTAVLPSNTIEEELNDDDPDDDVFETCKSPQLRTIVQPTSIASATRKNRRRQIRCAAASFIQSQAAVPDSEEEDEDELDEWESMESFVAPSGSQSSEADATCVDMQAVYLQSVRSPMVARGRFKIPVIRLGAEDSTSSPRSVIDLTDNDDDADLFANTSGFDTVRAQHEAIDSSFINDEVAIDSELSELEQAELILRERRRAAKRKRRELEATGTKRPRRILIMSDSE